MSTRDRWTLLAVLALALAVFKSPNDDAIPFYVMAVVTALLAIAYREDRR